LNNLRESKFLHISSLIIEIFTGRHIEKFN
jgi:hypothetical protein